MPYNLLLLPLLGGYVFISYWHHTRFDAKRYTGERLIFHAALAGCFFLALAYIITHAAAHFKPEIAEAWKAVVPFDYSGTSVLAFCLAATAWLPLNGTISRREHEAEKAVEQWGDFLEILIIQSIAGAKQISLTLTTGKVYIGFVTRSIDPAFDRRYLQIMPTLSGFRDSKTRDLIITRDYAQAYARLIEADSTFLVTMAEEFQLVIPTAEIVSANLFDPDVYAIFREIDEAPFPTVAAGGQ